MQRRSPVKSASKPKQLLAWEVLRRSGWFALPFQRCWRWRSRAG